MSEDEGKENQPVEDQEEEAEEAPIEETTETISTEPEAEEEEETQEAQAPEETLLLPRDTLLSAGIHIGTRMKTLDMEPFIYRVRPDGLFVLDVKKTDDRIRATGKFLSRYEPARVAVAATRLYAHEPVKMFCKLTGATPTNRQIHPRTTLKPTILKPHRPRNYTCMRSQSRCTSSQRSIQSRHPNRSLMQHR